MRIARKRLRPAMFALITCIVTIPYAGRAAEPFVIPVIIPETGAAAFLGKEEAQALSAVEALVNKSGGINGRPVKFLIEDDQSNPQIAVQLLNGVLSKNPSVVLGSSFVATCSAMAPLLEKAGPVEYCFSPGIHPSAGSYVFSASPSTADLLLYAARYFRERGWRKVAVITSTDATGQDADRGISAAFETSDSGETIVDREHFNTSDVSVAAQMAHVKTSGAQALIAWSTGTPFATLLRGAYEAGLPIPILTTSGNLTYAQMRAYAPFMSKDLYFSAFTFVTPEQIGDRVVRRAVDTFINAFKPFDVKPDVGQSLAWDPALLVVSAFRQLGVDATATQIRDYLSAVGSRYAYVGAYGRYNFKAVPQRGLGQDSVVMARWDPAKDTWVGVGK